MDATPFRSRFLRPSGEFQKNSSDENNEESSSYNNSNKRPSVSDLRKRYDQNRNHVETRTSPLTTKPPIRARSGESPVAPARRATIESNSDSEESGSRTPVNKTSLRRPEVVKNSSSGRKDFLRSSSPSTLSSTSSSSDDGETQVS